MRVEERSEAVFVENLSSYIQEREGISPPFPDLSEEIYQAALEADMLLEASHKFESAFSSLMEKNNHAKR